MKIASSALFATLALAAAPLAQQVTLRGKVEDVAGTTNQFAIACTTTRLSSAAFDLNAFVGQAVELSGPWNGSATAPAVVVSAIQSVAETFEIGGGAKIGKTASLGFTAAPGQVAIGFLAAGTSFLPFGGGSGVIFVDPARVVLSAAGTIGGSGILEIPVPVPNNPALIGVDVFGQGALIAPGGAVLLTNPDCKRISN